MENLLGDGDNLYDPEKIGENQDHYDAFMKRHLQHYGYYTGRNAAFRDDFRSLQEWRRNYDSRLSGHHNLSLVEEQLRRNASGQFRSKMLEAPSMFSGENQLPDELLHRTTQLVFQYQAGRKIPKLREPRNLYALTKEAGPQQATRWPSHIQVVCPAITFIDYNPPKPDPMYLPTGKEPTPAVRGSHCGEMIYYNDPGRDIYFMRSRVAGCRLAMRSTTLTPREYPEENCTLEFESRFESGNLLKVDKITDFDYELTLRTDLYTNKHTQWFFFRVRNMRPEKTYRFTVINLMKPSSLYSQGMKPVWYSEINAKKHQIGWIRMGSNIRYYRNNMCGRDGRTYYSLTWTCEFPYKDDCCYFAHCFPYTYSDLQEYLLQLANDPVRSRFCKQRVLCRTLAGNLVYILTITSPSRNPEISRSKRAVVLTARVHPGETNASWMMKGFLDYLTGNSADAKLLRDSFIFKIVPMLNPDGVIVGNYRCSLAGRDLNRNYKSVLKDSFPSIWHTKLMIKRLNAERQIVVYCDLHGHSRKNNIFIYGCENKHNRQKRLRERIFPLMLAKNASQNFCFESCKYKVQKSKEGTGRIVVWCMGVMNSYTLEATFGGTSLPGDRKNTQLSTRDLEMMGYHFCDTLLDYCDPDSSKVEACMRELQDRMRKQILKKLQMQNINVSDDMNLDDYISEMESDTSGSDSSCDDGLPVHLLAIAPKLQRKKKMRSRRDKMRTVSSKILTSGAEGTKPLVLNSAKLPNEKTKSLRYSQGSITNKRREDNSNGSSQNHTTGFSADQGNDRSAKKLPKVSLKYFDPRFAVMFSHAGFYSKTSQYLEALTSAYLRSGVLMIPDPEKDYSLRYSNSSNKASQDGNFTVQYLANHLGTLTATESDSESKPDSPLMRNVSCQWSPQPENVIESNSEDDEDVTKEAILAEEQYELLRQSAMRRQLSAGQQRLLAQKHLVAVAAMQQRNEEKQTMTSIISDRLSSSSKIQQHSRDHHNDESKNDAAPDPLMLVTKGTIRPNSRATSVFGASSFRESLPSRNSNSTTFERKSEWHHKREEMSKSRISSAKGYKRPVSGTSKTFKHHVIPPSTLTSIKADNVQPLDIHDTIVKNFGQKTIHSLKPENHHISMQPTSGSNHHFSSSNELHSRANNYISSKEENDDDILKSPHQTSKDILQKQSITESSAEKEKRTAFLSDSLWSSRKIHSSNILSTTQNLHRVNTISAESSQVGENVTNCLLTKPPRTRIINQTAMKGLIKGELTLPRTPDTTVIPSGIKKTTSLIMETDPDTLAIQNNRHYMKSEFGHKNQAKRHQSHDNSFFGMSDRIGPSAISRGGRVPPVVANIAELRRSLMGHGRDMSDNRNEHNSQVVSSQHSTPRKPLSDDFFHNIDNTTHLHFHQRNSKIKQLDQAYLESHPSTHGEKIPTKRIASLVDKTANDSLEMKKQYKVERENKRVKTSKANDMLDSDDEDWDDNLSTIVNTNDHATNRKDLKRGRGNVEHNENFVQNPVNDVTYQENIKTSRSEPGNRSYTQGNTTIEKTSDTSVTKIRIGSRTTERWSHVAEQWMDAHQRQEIVAGGLSTGKSEKHTVSAVSLNIDGEKDDRTCVTTPALASRPAPPLLRYLSAKQGQLKRKG